MPALLLALGLAAAVPKLAYRPDPKSTADTATVSLEMPRHSCFGVLRVSFLLSSQKSDRNRVLVMNVVVADSPSPERITGAEAGGAMLKLVNVRNGDVACTDYQCPTGSAALFQLGPAEREAVARDGALPIKVRTTGLKSCDVDLALDKGVLAALDGWADKLPPAKG